MTLLAGPRDAQRTGTVGPVGPGIADAELARWRDAAETGALPEPLRERWQPLRAGAVNLWEFDDAEYWFADGRCQFVGVNQSGKSTLMSLTTLILLAGDLHGQLVDTFGDRHRSFRYYVEASSDPEDRRDTDVSTSRGWAWVEYGRLVDGEPRYLTTLLYAQAKRGSRDLPRNWCLCTGPSRVGAGLALRTGAAAAAPRDLADAPGFRVAETAAEYRAAVADQLFGFDVGRLDTATRILRLLRTPHLGQRLDPDFVTEQMREALPALDRAEVDGLAEGWEQLDRLVADREAAVGARDAVATYLNRAWNPWADAVLRRAADVLVAANTRFDDVTRDRREAQTARDAAVTRAGELEALLSDAGAEARDAQSDYEQLLASAAYRDATTATQRVQSLRARADDADAAAAGAAADAARAAVVLDRRQAELAAAQDHLDAAVADLTAAVAAATAAGDTAGLGPDVAGWAGDRDIARLDAAIAGRRADVVRVGGLIRRAEQAGLRLDAAAEALARAEREHGERISVAADAATAVQDSVQELSDQVERWAAELGSDAPGGALRGAWLADVAAAVGSDAPRAVLAERLRQTWLAPTVEPLRERAAVDERRARDLTAEATRADAEADEVAARPEPAPPEPHGWLRRTRPPTAAGVGAPLWRVVDPRPGLGLETHGRIEAALAAAGLLDAWVTPDGVWAAGRDGDELVVTLEVAGEGGEGGEGGGRGGRDGGAGGGGAGADSLADVLEPSEDAGNLSGPVEALLARIGWTESDADLGRAFAVAADGRWRTPTASGRAGPVPDGPSLLGAAARAAERARRVERLRSVAADRRRDAAEAAATGASLRERVRRLETAARSAPDDAPAARAAQLARAAEGERERAAAVWAGARQRHDELEAAAADANAELLRVAGDRRLPRTADRLAAVGGALDLAGQAIAQLRVTDGSARSTTAARDVAQRVTDDAAAESRRGADMARRRADEAARARRSADTAASALGQEQAAVLQRAHQLDGSRTMLVGRVGTLEAEDRRQVAIVTAAEGTLAQADAARAAATTERESAVAAWWVPVDAGLAVARGIEDAPGRTVTAALSAAQAARRALRPRDWPEAADADSRTASVTAATSRLTGKAFIDLQEALRRSDGRDVAIHDPEAPTGLPGVLLTVDSGPPVPPRTALGRLADQVERLSAEHDEKMHQILGELLTSTFVEHLRERVGRVVEQLDRVNRVLAAHPTGADRRTIRLRRVPAAGQHAAYEILSVFEHGSMLSAEVEQQVRSFLEQQVREAQDRARDGDGEWTDHLADLLDYRRWFDVVLSYRCGESDWRPLTRQVHARDSGGGKVVSLLQPLLATLVALYDESPGAPRPLWLDEAFTGVDDANRAQMLDLLVRFDLDLLLAGPATLVTVEQVPAAAVWHVTRAPAPVPGVDLSLMLWAGHDLTHIELPDRGLDAAPRVLADGDMGLFDLSGTGGS